MKLWDKGYDIDRFTEEFTIGKDRELDVMLAKADVLGNMAHLKMLHHIGLISDGELKDLAQGLKDIFAEIEQGKFHIEAGIEDIHSQIECLLTRKCGEAGKKIHTGRSRNDQVLTDLKLFTRTALIDVLQQVTSLFHLLMEKAEANKDILMPGYTHLQIAMPSSFGMWFSALCGVFGRRPVDVESCLRYGQYQSLGIGSRLWFFCTFKPDDDDPVIGIRRSGL